MSSSNQMRVRFRSATVLVPPRRSVRPPSGLDHGGRAVVRTGFAARWKFIEVGLCGEDRHDWQPVSGVGPRDGDTCAEYRINKGTPGCTLDRQGRALEFSSQAQDACRATCGLCAKCQRAAGEVEARLLELGSTIDSTMLDGASSMITNFCPTGGIAQLDDWAVGHSVCFGRKDASYSMDIRPNQLVLRTINRAVAPMSFAVSTPNDGGVYVVADTGGGSRDDRVTARVWEAGDYAGDYSFGMPELRAGAIRGFGTTLCPTQYPGLTVNHLFLVSDSVGALHLFDPRTGSDSITGISPAASFVYVMFVTGEISGCSHSTAARPAFAAGLRHAIFEASLGLATCPYSDEFCPAGDTCTDACACSTGVAPRLYPSGMSGQLVQTPFIGCSSAGDEQGLCRVQNPAMCHEVHTNAVIATTNDEVFPLGFGGFLDRGIAVAVPHMTKSCLPPACPQNVCHPEAKCMPTLGGYLCQCHTVFQGPPGFVFFGAGSMPCGGEGTDLVGRQYLSLRECATACHTVNGSTSTEATCNGFSWNSQDQRCYLKHHECSMDAAACPWARRTGDDDDWNYFSACTQCSSDGPYTTNFGRINIHGDSGTYIQVAGGLFDIAWTRTADSVLQGRFRNGNRLGRFEFTFDADCNNFAGRWAFGDAPLSGDWSGTRQVSAGRRLQKFHDPGSALQPAANTPVADDQITQAIPSNPISPMVAGTCDERITCRHGICICGSVELHDTVVVARTYRILIEAQDLLLHGNVTDAKAELENLCAEAHYPFLDCLHWSDSVKTEMQSCYLMACGLARNMEMGRNIYETLASNEVLPLTPDEYARTLDTVLTYLDHLNGAVRAYTIGGDVLTAQADVISANAENAGDSIGTLQHKIYEKQQLMDKYAGLIRHIQSAINLKISDLSSSMNNVVSHLQIQLQDVKDAFEHAKEEALDQSIFELIAAVIKAVIDVVIMVFAPELSATEMAVGCAIDAAAGAAGSALSSELSAPESPYSREVTDQLQGLDQLGDAASAYGEDPQAWSNFKAQAKQKAKSGLEDQLPDLPSGGLLDGASNCGGLMSDARAIFTSAKRLANAKKNDCGALSREDCQEFAAKMRKILEKIQTAEAFVDALPALMQLNHAITTGEAPTASAMVRISTDELQLDRLDESDSAALNSIGLGGDTAQATKLADTIRLIRTKLAQTTSYYSAALEKRDMELQAALEHAAQDRLVGLVQRDRAQVKQYQLIRSRAEQKIRTYSYLALTYIFAEARAYEYLTLEPLGGKLDVASLQTFANTSALVQNLHEVRVG
jgi:hypothetical protein